MKVTSIVKQAIEEAVNNKASAKMENLHEIKEKLEQQQNADYEFLKNAFRARYEKIVEEFAKLPLAQKYTCGIGYRPINYISIEQDLKNNSVALSCIASEDYKKVLKDIEKLRSDINTKVNEIVLALELGGSKKDLDDLLAKVKF